MIKNVTLSGLSTTPSSHEAQDGEIAAMLNLVPEDGALKPLHQPFPVGSLDEGDEEIAADEMHLWVHETPDYLHYIKRKVDGTWWWGNRNVFKDGARPPQHVNDHVSNVYIDLRDTSIRVSGHPNVFVLNLISSNGDVVEIKIPAVRLGDGYCDVLAELDASATYRVGNVNPYCRFILTDYREIARPDTPVDPDAPEQPEEPEQPADTIPTIGNWVNIPDIIGNEVKSIAYIGNILVIAMDDQPLQYVIWNMEKGRYVSLGFPPRVEADFRLQGELAERRYKDVMLCGKGSEIDDSNVSENRIYNNLLYSHTTKGSNLDGHMYMTTESWEDLCSIGVKKGKTYLVKRVTEESNHNYLTLTQYNAEGQRKTGTYLYKHGDSKELTFEEGDYLRLGSSRSSVWHTGKVTYEIWGEYDDTDTPYFAEDTIDNFNAVLGCVSNYTRVIGEEKGKFVEPFLVRYSIKLYDGFNIYSSAPMLMIPNSGLAPKLLATCDEGKYGGKENNTTIYAWAFACDLMCKFGNTDEIAKWKDYISGITIEVSRPITRLKTDAQWIKGERKIKCLYYDNNEDSRLHLTEYALLSDGKCMLSTLKTKNSPYEFIIEPPLKSDAEFSKAIIDTTGFYRIADLKVEDILADGYEEWTKIDTETFNTMYPETGVEVKTDTLVTGRIFAENLYSYNGRMHIGNLKEELQPEGFAISGIVSKEGKLRESQYKYRINVQTKKDGVTYNLWSEVKQGYAKYAQYFFSHDPDVFKAVIYSESSDGLDRVWYKSEFNVSTHELITGSYAYIKEGLTWIEASESEMYQQAPELPVISHKNELYISEVQNPFVYPAANAVQCGRGEILNIAANTETVSEGQFGEAPLYAFTKEETWLLSLASTGVYQTKQPLSNVVCINPKNICSLDNAVVFTTVNGIMLAQGKTVQCISDQLRDQVSKYTLPHLHDVMQACSIFKESDYLPDYTYDEDWLTFLRTCVIVHDKVNNRIVVSPQESHLSFVYSLRSNLWGMQELRITGTVNKAGASWILTDYSIADLSNPDDAKTKEKEYPNQYVITRPMGIEESDAFKRIKAMIVRGYFRKHHLACALYGSRDLFNWRLIHTSKDHYLRGMSGTPYKYFIAVIPASLADDESMQGISFEYEYIMTNQVR